MRFKLDSEWEANGVHRHYEQSRAMVGTRAPIDWIVVTKKKPFYIQNTEHNGEFYDRQQTKLKAASAMHHVNQYVEDEKKKKIRIESTLSKQWTWTVTSGTHTSSVDVNHRRDWPNLSLLNSVLCGLHRCGFHTRLAANQIERSSSTVCVASTHNWPPTMSCWVCLRFVSRLTSCAEFFHWSKMKRDEKKN